jgi:protoheme IX farnesyltransferase
MITAPHLALKKQNRLADYIQLTKPRIVLLLIFTTVSTLVIANQGAVLKPVTLLATIVGGALSAGGASALNQYLERDLDAQMARTKNRPLPSGRIAPLNGLLFGLGLLGWSTFILAAWVNWLSAGLALVGAAYYVVIYTLLLKRNTELNIIVGGGAGAVPVLVGWAAATGHLAPPAFLLFAIVFFWTPPHSWALSLYIEADYERGNVPMLPVTRGAELTRWQIVWYALLLVLLTLLPVPLGMFSFVYFSAVVLLDIGLSYRAFRLLSQATKLSARQLYKYSSLYLMLLFMVMLLDKLLISRG